MTSSHIIGGVSIDIHRTQLMAIISKSCVIDLNLDSDCHTLTSTKAPKIAILTLSDDEFKTPRASLKIARSSYKLQGRSQEFR